MSNNDVTQTTQSDQAATETAPAAETTATETATAEAATSKKGKVWNIIMIVLCILLIPVIVINVTLVIKSMTAEGLPDIFGYAALSVTSPSMDGDKEDSFPQGSLIIVKILSDEDKQNLVENDVVTYIDSDGAYVTHRIIGISTSDGEITYVRTKGDANDSDDGLKSIDNVVALVVTHINGLGNFAMFLQEPYGMLVIIGVPVLIVVLAYVISVFVSTSRKTAAQTAAVSEKDEEIRRLKEQLAEKNKKEGEE